MPALDAGGTGIDGHHVILRVTHDFEDMGMSADKYLGTPAVDQSPCPEILMPGIATDMHHQH